eukprot:jgi/Bigna1/65093/fgenesh1_kg.97_\
MMYRNAMIKICFQPAVRYVMGRNNPEPVSYGVAIRMMPIPKSDGKLGSLVVHSIQRK